MTRFEILIAPRDSENSSEQVPLILLCLRQIPNGLALILAMDIGRGGRTRCCPLATTEHHAGVKPFYAMMLSRICVLVQ